MSLLVAKIPASPQTSTWFIRSRANFNATIRLFCFPYAGGGPAIFSQWPFGLPAYLEVLAAHFPGRGSRHHVSPFTSLKPLVESLSQAIQPYLDRPFAFFGHSLGALVAFELTRDLRQKNLPAPVYLFVSACSAPHLPYPHQFIHSLRETEFFDALQQFNGLPEEVLYKREVLDFFLPALRADFEIFESYQYTPELPLSCPIFAFGGLDDQQISPDSLESWALHTSSSFRSKYIPGDHFFLITAREPILSTISTELKASL